MNIQSNKITKVNTTNIFSYLSAFFFILFFFVYIGSYDIIQDSLLDSGMVQESLPCFSIKALLGLVTFMLVFAGYKGRGYYTVFGISAGYCIIRAIAYIFDSRIPYGVIICIAIEILLMLMVYKSRKKDVAPVIFIIVTICILMLIIMAFGIAEIFETHSIISDIKNGILAPEMVEDYFIVDNEKNIIRVTQGILRGEELRLDFSLIKSIIVFCLTFIINVGAIILFGIWFLTDASEYTVRTYEKISDGFMEMSLHVLLMLIVPFIYSLVWVYRTTKYLNNCEDAPYRRPVSKLLLYMLIPFYHIYWTYQSAKRVDMMAYRYDTRSNIKNVCLVLQIFFPVITPIIIQSKINSVCSAVQVHDSNKKKFASSNFSEADEIMKYKKLLDDGIITSEEFEQKKNDLLGR